uniref:NADH-ubiquinone oxidoreductase chain 3 n=1 Tax=Obrium sp. NS-2015 TaxID=1776756 RepID=A0A0U4IRZ4_9CUCU|nr:NADH dehydrogenase subunit 3 [Obrium sp. NS-2015]
MKAMAILYNLVIIMLLIISAIITMMAFKEARDREKSSPFECGFDPKTHARLPFSLQFFLVGVIFLIFDVEITLLMPMIFALSISNIMNYTCMATLFILILILGLFHEWNQGALNWVN